jgi:hypothetical protein
MEPAAAGGIHALLDGVQEGLLFGGQGGGHGFALDCPLILGTAGPHCGRSGQTGTVLELADGSVVWYRLLPTGGPGSVTVASATQRGHLESLN